MAMPTMTWAAKLKIENQRSRLNGRCTGEAAPPASLIVLVPEAELIALPRRTPPSIGRPLINHRTIHVPILVRNAIGQAGRTRAASRGSRACVVNDRGRRGRLPAAAPEAGGPRPRPARRTPA